MNISFTFLKKILLIFISLWIINLSSYAIDPENFIKEITDARNTLYNAYGKYDLNGINKAEDILQEINKKYPDSYIVYYYMAQSNLYEAFIYNMENKEKRFKIAFEAGMKNIERSIELKDDFAESLILLAQFYGYNIFMEGYRSAANNNRLVKINLEQATKLDPNNPRLYLVYGTNYLHTPEAYGGNIENAEELLQKSLALFNSYTLEKEYYPNWGKDEIYVWLGKISLHRDNRESAKEFYRMALEANPEFGWAQYELEQLEYPSKSGNVIYPILIILLIIIAPFLKK
ncbi:MAG: hypothetical protein LIO79_05075 [Rikenellaceae bacterium]|nr:hypothetical protein [Rikenellaceae bacterium]